MFSNPNSPKVVRDETLRLATTHLAESAIVKSRAQLDNEIRQILLTAICMPVIASILALGLLVSDQMWIGIVALLVLCGSPALFALLLFKLNDRRELNNRLIAEFELRRRYNRV